MSELTVESINAYYDESHVLYDASLSVFDGQLVSLIGRNGAGKTTLLKSIMGMVEVNSGKITFDNDPIQNLEPDEISQLGIGIIPEGRGLFPELTVKENLRLGHLGHGPTRSQEDLFEEVFTYFPRLSERLGQRAGSMSGGEKQMLSIGRALVSEPDLLLVDEPTEGLMPSLVEELKSILIDINQDGTTVLLVEQNFQLALEISDYNYVIDEGRIRAEGERKDILDDDDVKDKYLVV
jgi:branched-chain amino acid transport system ATP-binding protein